MRRLARNGLVVLWAVCGFAASTWAEDAASSADRVDFSRDIRPILSDNCFTCHGPDEETREADLRFDLKADDFADRELVVPGKPEESELLARVAAEDEDERMPPPEAQRQLSAEQVATIRRWIEQGGEWQEHWSFVTPKRPPLPGAMSDRWVRNPIDCFVLARLTEEGLGPAPEADRVTMLRRVTLDLTGLPPTPEEVDAFLADESADAYEKAVDRLLASTRYGEQMARYWLDVARYGDTHGLHLDNERSMWPYRDWVVRAYNDNKPFDEFTVEQLAGDLLADPTVDQLVATGFNRCNVTSSEGGSIEEELRVRYAVDRTTTVGTVWMGLTTGCAVCHDHKYDPVTQKEFYELYAFFNNIADKGMDGNALLPPPSVKVATPEQREQLAAIEKQTADVQAKIEAALAAIDYADPGPGDEPTEAKPEEIVWIDDALPPGAVAGGDGNPAWQFVGKPDHPVLSGEKSHLRTSTGRTQHFFTGAKPGLTVAEGDVLFAYVYLDPDNPPGEIMLQFNDGAWEHRAYWGGDLIDWGAAGTASRRPKGDLPKAGEWARIEVEVGEVGLKPGAVINGWAFTQFDGTVHWDKAGIVTTARQGARRFESLLAWGAYQKSLKKPSTPDVVQKALAVEADKRDDAQKQQIRDYFLEHVCTSTRATFGPLHKQAAELKTQKEQLDKQIPSSLIAREVDKPRPAHLLDRGEYDRKKDVVERGVPAVLPPLVDDAPRNRLGLARWLVEGSHPLTARVTVNRLWQQLFGTGIVKTAEDFGSQGDPPSHAELLDWLAVEFVESGWDVKHIMRLMVTSAAYRQTSSVGPELYVRDPQNRLLARGPRFRMDAEMVRDTVLDISGLLVERLGGRGVRPYQPAGLWKAVAYPSSGTARFQKDQGEALYRRSLYTFLKRTSPPPTMRMFDAPSREACIARRERTNTPLAALALLNDIQFVEAARHLAERMIAEAGASPEACVDRGFRLATAREPSDTERAVLLAQYNDHLAEFKQNTEAAAKLLSTGDSARNEKLDPAQHAAWTMVANTLLNLDETITKE